MMIVENHGSAAIVVEQHDGIVVATLNRPERRNALTFDMFADIARICAQADADDTVRALIFTGAGAAFCAGLDLDDAEKLPSMPLPEMVRGQEQWARSIAALRNISTPVIAAVNGAAAGAGFSLALAADVRIASTAARFNAAFVRIGLSGGDCGSSWLLPRIVGLGHASELLLTGRFVDAEEALRIGLVNRFVDPDDLLPTAMEVARGIAANSPFGVRLTKRVIQANVDAPSLEAAIELENRNQVLTAHTDDMREALVAFREKRPPEFTGS
jgi:enoyl-CoA hydratase/carnithine racemase